jgi:hypothetical protein
MKELQQRLGEVLGDNKVRRAGTSAVGLSSMGNASGTRTTAMVGNLSSVFSFAMKSHSLAFPIFIASPRRVHVCAYVCVSGLLGDIVTAHIQLGGE